MNKDQIITLMFSVSNFILLITLVSLYGADTWLIGVITWAAVVATWLYRYVLAFNGQGQYPGFTAMYVAAVMSNIMMLLYTPEAMPFLAVCTIVHLVGVYFSEGKYDELKAQLSAA